MNNARAIFAPGPIEIECARANLLEVRERPGGCSAFYRIAPCGDGDTYRSVVEAFSSGEKPRPWAGLPGMTSMCRLLAEGFVLEVDLDASYAVALDASAVRLETKRGQTVQNLVSSESMKLLLAGAMSQSGALLWE